MHPADPLSDATTAGRLNPWMDITGIQGSRILGRIREPVPESTRHIRELLESENTVVFFERTEDGHAVTCAPRPPRPRTRLWVNALLFVATVGTTLLVGALNRGGNPLRHPLDILLGIPFSFSIILVLGSHELAHYFAARRLGVAATPPYFLPVPHPMTGTMGAFIRIQSPVPNRGALVRVGVAGPLVGFLVALPVSVIGLALSKPVPVNTTPGIQLGSPLIFKLISDILHPALPPGTDLLLHPMAFAGWLGLFVTALNLLPVGQLDGGHVAYALFGRPWRRWSLLLIAALVGLGFFWLGWPFWAVLTTILGLGHPPPLDDITPLSRADKWLALAALLIFALTFTPVPFGAARL